MQKCIYCEEKPQGWVMRDYYGIWGPMCDDCYQLVAHDAFGEPKNPGGWAYFVLKYL